MSRPHDPVVQARARGQFVADAHPENEHRRRRRSPQARGPPDQGDDAAADRDGAFSIRSFCKRHEISESFFYKLRALGLAPAIMKVGARTLISREAAAAWRRRYEAAAARSQALKPTPSGRERLRDRGAVPPSET
jgi:hypothetical protein